MLRKIIIGAVLFSLILALVACAGSASKPAPSPTPTPAPKPAPSPTLTPVTKPSEPIKAKWIEPQVNGDTVSIPLNELENNLNVHFKLETQEGEMTFMAYKYDGEIYVRANICPPCRSIGYTLEEDILICDTCATTFEAKTGAGIKGACVNYPKAPVSYQTINGNIVMNEADLVSAYQDTIKRG